MFVEQISILICLGECISRKWATLSLPPTPTPTPTLPLSHYLSLYLFLYFFLPFFFLSLPFSPLLNPLTLPPPYIPITLPPSPSTSLSLSLSLPSPPISLSHSPYIQTCVLNLNRLYWMKPNTPVLVKTCQIFSQADITQAASLEVCCSHFNHFKSITSEDLSMLKKSD